MKVDTKRHGRKRVTAAVGIAAVVLAVLGAGQGAAQSVSFEQLLIARETTAVLERDGVVIAGIAGGGLLFAPAADPGAWQRLSAGDELSGNDVSDLAWTGENVWVATRGGGLTRITDVAGARDFRQFASSRNALDVTAVAGNVVNGVERVYYGLAGGGVGLISDGAPRTVYTTNDGLVSDDVTTLAVIGDVLYVGTPQGVSRFADNFFTTVNDSLGDLGINDLAVESDGHLLAGTESGLFRWDEAGETWSVVAGQTNPVREISCRDGFIYVRLAGTIREFDGSVWRVVSGPTGQVTALHAGASLWSGGTIVTDDPTGFDLRSAYLARHASVTSFTHWEVDAMQTPSPWGVAMSGDTPYIGTFSFESVLSHPGADAWVHNRFQSTSSTDPTRLPAGQILSAEAGPDGDVWIGLYSGTGLGRVDAEDGTVTAMNRLNSGLRGQHVINVRVHPDGPVITMHDQTDTLKVEILVDPANWSSAGSWLAVPNARLGAVESTDINDTVVQRRDVIWFAVSDVGLVRWDINGASAGPDDPLTWFDDSDDSWITVTSVTGASQSLGAAFALETGADGTIWVGGNGLLQFRYDEAARRATAVTSLLGKELVDVIGLVDGNVVDLARDFNGDMWVAASTGVNRVRGSGAGVEVDAYLDLANYMASDANRAFYSSSAIRPLPGQVYRRICASADRRRILVSANQGVSLITVGRDTGGGAGGAVATAYVYPNPYLGGQVDGGLKLGGLDGDVTARVEIYNLEGQLVYQAEDVAPGEGFWTGINRVGQDVTTGMYLVRVVVDGMAQAFPLSVVR